ncbi:class I SAM-dependent methyltransferase [uncultured Pontibacter sp.]|uniref:class I SAM-dependent methyltransferase n=1 Tax=uncultured Pontibacter sp. TaxID=453356 RepID=UPI0026358566|nr:class I SAM-dependent methyltransferase [uncultured Pontibacter sp.]
MNIRLQLFELEDQRWFPHVVRQGMLDYLRFMITKLETYEAALPLLEELLVKTKQHHIIDLCAGAGGGIAGIREGLSKRMAATITVTLTDLYPNLDAYEYLQNESKGAIDFIPEPVNALNVPENLHGVRSIFSSFHHFPPQIAQSILQDAVNKRAAIGIFEGAKKSWTEMLLLWLTFPFAIIFVTPFIRPFKFSRLFFTYVIPLIPLGILWDGTVSLLRIYPPGKLQKMANKVSGTSYTWKAGRAGKGPGKHVIYLIGYPETSD